MKKALALLFAAVILVSMLAACGNSNGSSSGSSTPGASSGSEAPATPEVDFTEHETFTIWQQSDSNDYYSDPSDNPVTRYLTNMFNVTLSYERPPAGAEMDSLSLMLGTGEYTDMFNLDYLSTSLSDLYEDGVIINIADYLDSMPNLKAHIEQNPGFARNMYDDSGRILSFKHLATEPALIWGGLVYRRDILETMTDGNISFPSGNDEPTTIEDWDYMLPLFKAYFEAAGMENYAAFILPYTGIFAYSEMTNGFGVGGQYYLEDGQVKYGPMEDGFYNYLSKMREWYELGYIYQDFASRTNDPVYFPNTELTYGGAAGAWYGLQSSLGDAMSMPEYDLYFDVQPALNPLDTEHGITEAAPFSLPSVDDISSAGYAVSTSCSNIPKLLAIIDYLYSEDARLLALYGLTAEQGAATDPVMIKAGLEDGYYWFDENGEFVFNPLLATVGGPVDGTALRGSRICFYQDRKYEREFSDEKFLHADAVWGAYPDAKLQSLPNTIDLGEDGKAFNDNRTKIDDMLFTTIVGFITGTNELNETTWEAFRQQLVSLGIEDNIAYQQAAYERYLNRV